MPDKTITILNDIPIYAGIGQYNRDLIELLLSNGYKVKNVSYNSYVFDHPNLSNVRLQRPFERFKFSQNLITFTNSNFAQFKHFLTPPSIIASQSLVPLGAGINEVAIVVHDINQLHLLGYDLISAGLTVMKYHFLAKYKHIVAVSKFVKQDLVNHFRVDEGSISVLYEWIDISKIKILKLSERRINSKSVYLIHVGNDQPNKKVDLVYRVMMRLPSSYKLIRVGSNSMRNLRFLKRNNLLERVQLYQGISKDKLEDLYNSANIFLYPSTYEGFGRPLLEAMAHGLPVVYRNSSSLPEVAGNAGIAFDDDNEDLIAEMIQNVAEQNNYSQLCKKSIERSKSFDISNLGSLILKTFDALFESQ